MKKYKINFSKQINFLFYLTLFIFMLDIAVNIYFVVDGSLSITNINRFNGAPSEITQNSIKIVINVIFFVLAFVAMIILFSIYFGSKCYTSEKFINYKYGFFKKEIKNISVIGVKVDKDIVIVFYKKNNEEKYVAAKLGLDAEKFVNDIKENNKNVYIERI